MPGPLRAQRLTKVPKAAQSMVATLIRSIFEHPTPSRSISSTPASSSSWPNASLTPPTC